MHGDALLSLAIACLLVLVYTYLGYPILIGMCARWFPRRAVIDGAFTPTVSVCIAAYNADATLDAKLDSLLAQTYPADRIEVLIYSDGSTDATDEIAGRWAARDARFRLIRGGERRGKPTALNRMREVATGEVLVLTDSRQPVAPEAIRALCDQLSDPQVGCVSGNLILEGKAGSGAYWRYENWIRAREAGFRSLVGMTGPLAALRRVDLSPLPEDVILDDVWIPMKVRLRGLRVAFAAGAKAFDRAFEDEREFRRKVRTLAGNYQIFRLMPALLVPFLNPIWFETFSHKILRLVCPWALLGLAATSAMLVSSADTVGIRAATAGGVLLGAQLVFYGAALIGARAGRLGGLARTFTVMHIAAVVGLWRFITGGQRITW